MMGIEMTEEEKRMKELYVQTRADLFDVLAQLLETPDDVSFLPRIVAALTLLNRRDEEQKAYYEANGQRREQIKQSRIEETLNLKAVKKTAAAARADLLRAQIEADKMERLALQGRKQAIVQIALATGDLQAITEDRIQEVVNSQRRSNGGVIRIESGAGK